MKFNWNDLKEILWNIEDRNWILEGNDRNWIKRAIYEIINGKGDGDDPASLQPDWNAIPDDMRARIWILEKQYHFCDKWEYDRISSSTHDAIYMRLWNNEMDRWRYEYDCDDAFIEAMGNDEGIFHFITKWNYGSWIIQEYQANLYDRDAKSDYQKNLFDWAQSYCDMNTRQLDC